MVYICTKFHENILNSIRVKERTRKVNGQTDVRTDGWRERHNMARLRQAYENGEADFRNKWYESKKRFVHASTYFSICKLVKVELEDTRSMIAWFCMYVLSWRFS